MMSRDREQKFEYQWYGSGSGWNALLPPRTPTAPLQGRNSAKYLIVGAGFTGLGAARRLAELDPSADIIVIDRDEVGENSSGRNSGNSTRNVAWTPERTPPKNSEEYFNGQGFLWLAQICKEHNIDWRMSVSNMLRGTRTDSGRAILEAQFKKYDKIGLKPVLYEGEDLYRKVGTRFYKTVLHYGESYDINPAALIRGLADNLPKQVALYERTVMRSMHRQGKGWRVETDGGVIDAEVLLLCMNGFVKEFGVGSNKLVSLYTYCSLSEVVPDNQAHLLGEWKAWGMTSVRRIGSSTHRRLASNRFMLRSLHSYEERFPLQFVAEQLTEKFHRRFPELSHIKLEHVWGGLTDMTRNGAPLWGEIEDGLWVSTGYNGLGITKGSYLGRRLAERITGDTSDVPVEQSYGIANWIPPEPFRKVGFEWVTSIGMKRAGGDTL